VIYANVITDVDLAKPLSDQFLIKDGVDNVIALTGVDDRDCVTTLVTLACRGTCMLMSNNLKAPIWTNPISDRSVIAPRNKKRSSSIDAFGDYINVAVVPYVNDYGDDLQLIPIESKNEQTKEKISFNQINTVWDVSYTSLSRIEESVKKVLQRNHRKIRIRQLALDCIEESGGSVPALVRKTRIGGMVGAFIVEASRDRAKEIAGAVRKLRECGKRLEKYRHISKPNIALFYRGDNGEWNFRHNWTDASVDGLFPAVPAVAGTDDHGDPW
jgi:hypothetical protein